jgi:flagellar biosynthesis/type III secretory pathway protein FliH
MGKKKERREGRKEGRKEGGREGGKEGMKEGRNNQSRHKHIPFTKVTKDVSQI